jgi:hypothetical protein
MRLDLLFNLVQAIEPGCAISPPMTFFPNPGRRRFSPNLAATALLRLPRPRRRLHGIVAHLLYLLPFSCFGFSLVHRVAGRFLRSTPPPTRIYRTPVLAAAFLSYAPSRRSLCATPRDLGTSETPRRATPCGGHRLPRDACVISLLCKVRHVGMPRRPVGPPRQPHGPALCPVRIPSQIQSGSGVLRLGPCIFCS